MHTAHRYQCAARLLTLLTRLGLADLFFHDFISASMIQCVVLQMLYSLLPVFFLMIMLPLISTLFSYTSLFLSVRKSPRLIFFFFLNNPAPPEFSSFPPPDALPF